MPWIRQLVNLNRFDNKPVSQSSATADDWLTGLLIRLITTSQPNAHENDIDKYESGIYVQSLVYSLQTNQKSS